MKRLAIILIALLAPLLAAEEVTRKVVEVRYANPNAIRDMLANFGVDARADGRLKAIVLSGPANAVAQAEAAITKLDVPQPAEKNIEMLAYLVLASNDASTASEPADLAPAIKQMRSLFQYKSYRLLDTIWVRTKEGEHIESTGMAPAALKLDPNFDPSYKLTANRATIISGDSKTVRFDGFDLWLTLRVARREAVSTEGTYVRIGSSFDVREGQKVVIGKTNPAGADTAVIVVVTAKVVE
jgi:hypothetical protein